MAGSALQGIRVVDLSSAISGQYCGRLLADYGANVELIERSDIPSRTRNASLPDDHLPEGESFLNFHLNRGKSVRSVVNDPSADELGASLSQADVVIVDERTQALFGEIAPNAQSIVCSLTPFGADAGDVGQQVGNELVYQALSGTMYLNGDAEAVPLYGVGDRASYAAGTVGYIEILSCVLAKRSAFIDVSIVEVATSMNFNCITQFSYSGFVERRGDKTVPRSTIRCSDGWVTIFLRDHRWARAMNAFGLEWLTTDPRFSTEQERLAHWDEFESVLGGELATWKANEVVRVGQSVDGVVAKAKSIEELLSEPHLLGRGFWSGAPEELCGIELVPLGPVFPEPSPWAGARSASDAVDESRSVWPPSDAETVGPLAGLRVLDCATAWSGPMASHVLAVLGADVIKVEGPHRVDDWRGNARGSHWARYPNGQHLAEPHNRNCQFNTQNTDKRDICLDAKDEQGAKVIGELMSTADVVITNFRGNWLARMGFDDAFFAARNPRAIGVAMTAYGSGGELSSHAALGPSLEMMSGMGGLIGYGDGRPISTGPAYLDPVGALNAAAAVVTALIGRDRVGVGGFLEVTQREAAMHWIGDEFYRVQAGLRPSVGNGPDDSGNRVPLRAPHAAYATHGVDQWIAIGVETDAQFMRLRELVGDPRLLDPDLDTAVGRKAKEDLIDEVIGEWALPQDKHALAERIRDIGVPAAPVMDSSDLWHSSYLRARGLVQEMDHPACGRHLYQTLPLHISGYDIRPRRPAPLLGEHTDSILTGLGVPASVIADLRASMVITETPLPRKH